MPGVWLERRYAAQNQIDSGVRVRSMTVPAVQLGDMVFKVGIGSGATNGRVVELQALMEIYGAEGPSWFEDLFAIEGTGPRFSAPGDTGAIIVRHSDGAALGILLGGTERITVAAPIQPLLDRFGCTLIAPGYRRTAL
jgi:hypothetical protein